MRRADKRRDPEGVGGGGGGGSGGWRGSWRERNERIEKDEWIDTERKRQKGR